MEITATELKNNLSHYLKMASKETIYITQYGKLIAKISPPFEDRRQTAQSLFGILDDDLSLEEARKERLKRQ